MALGQVGYGYPPPTGFRSSYRYNQPTISQYESFFNPIPLDFLQEQLNQRQGRYDAAFAGALTAKDQLAQTQVGLADLAAKNQIIQEGLTNIDNLVTDKYGGDWGKASKEVARNVTQLRSNPFWNAQLEVQKKRDLFDAQVAKYGPKAMLFGTDPRTLSTIDPRTGQVRGQDQFTGEVLQQGNWGKTAREIFSSLTPDKYQSYGLTEAEVAGFLKTGETTAITRGKLEKLASDPDVQRAFQQSHPEFTRGFQELDQTQKERFGLQGDNLQEVTKRTILGNVAPAAFTQQNVDYMQNPIAVNAAKAGDTANPYIPSSNEYPIVNFESDALKEHKKRLNPQAFHAGTSGPVTGGPLAAIPVLTTDMTGEQRQNEIQRAAGVRDQALNAYYDELVQTYPELQGMDRQKAFGVVSNYLQKRSADSRIVYNVHLDDSPANIKSQLISNIRVGNFESFEVRNATGDVTGKKNIVDALGYKSYEDMVAAIKDKDIAPRIDFSQGKIVVDIPTRGKKKKGGEPVGLYFSPDKETQEVLDVGQAVTEMMTNAQSYGDEARPIPIPDGRGGYTGDAIFVVGEGDIVNGNNKQIWVVNQSDPTARPKQLSREQLNEYLTELIDVKYNNYQGRIGNPGKE